MQEFIPVDTFCHYHSIDVSFINRLHEFNIIEVVHVNDSDQLRVRQLTEIERLIRLHNELDINEEGLHAVSHLLQKLKNMQHEIDILKKRLHLYEPE